VLGEILLQAFMYRLRESEKKLKIYPSLEEDVCRYQGMFKMLNLAERWLALNILLERNRAELAVPTSGDKKSSDPAFCV
jgi:hypothetical protein